MSRHLGAPGSTHAATPRARDTSRLLRPRHRRGPPGGRARLPADPRRRARRSGARSGRARGGRRAAGGGGGPAARPRARARRARARDRRAGGVARRDRLPRSRHAPCRAPRGWPRSARRDRRSRRRSSSRPATRARRSRSRALRVTTRAGAPPRGSACSTTSPSRRAACRPMGSPSASSSSTGTCHHGDGTQAIFWEDPSVYVLSLHAWPHYPGTGSASERRRGRRARRGTCPFRSARRARSTGGSSRSRFDAVASPSSRPDLVLVSAGFDCLAGDPHRRAPPRAGGPARDDGRAPRAAPAPPPTGASPACSRAATSRSAWGSAS